MVSYMLPSKTYDLQYYFDPKGRSPFAEWFEDLDPVTTARLSKVIARMGEGNLSNLKSVGHGVHEYRMHYGPGYRVYLGFDGETLLILLGGGTKQRQQKDIEEAQARWQDYKRRKK